MINRLLTIALIVAAQSAYAEDPVVPIVSFTWGLPSAPPTVEECVRALEHGSVVPPAATLMPERYSTMVLDGYFYSFHIEGNDGAVHCMKMSAKEVTSE